MVILVLLFSMFTDYNTSALRKCYFIIKIIIGKLSELTGAPWHLYLTLRVLSGSCVYYSFSHERDHVLSASSTGVRAVPFFVSAYS